MCRIVALAVVIPLLVVAVPAQSETPIAEIICAPREQMLDRLRLSYGAELAGSGLRSAEAMIEVWAAPDGDWTLVQSYVDGRSCIVAMGEGWDNMALPGAMAAKDPA